MRARDDLWVKISGYTVIIDYYPYRVEHPGEFYDGDPRPTAVTMET